MELQIGPDVALVVVTVEESGKVTSGCPLLATGGTVVSDSEVKRWKSARMLWASQGLSDGRSEAAATPKPKQQAARRHPTPAESEASTILRDSGRSQLLVLSKKHRIGAKRREGGFPCMGSDCLRLRLAVARLKTPGTRSCTVFTSLQTGGRACGWVEYVIWHGKWGFGLRVFTATWSLQKLSDLLLLLMSKINMRRFPTLQ